MLSAVLVQVKGWQRSFQPSMKRRIMAMRSLTLVKLMETLRDMGVEDRLMREAIPLELMGNTTYCTSLAGEELGRIPSWGTDTVHRADYELQSPCAMLDAPQTITEPVLVKAAQERGAKVRFDTEYLSHVQEARACPPPCVTGSWARSTRFVRNTWSAPTVRGARSPPI
jgi:hypothetical protein